MVSRVFKKGTRVDVKVKGGTFFGFGFECKVNRLTATDSVPLSLRQAHSHDDRERCDSLAHLQERLWPGWSFLSCVPPRKPHFDTDSKDNLLDSFQAGTDDSSCTSPHQEKIHKQAAPHSSLIISHDLGKRTSWFGMMCSETYTQ